MILLIMRLWFNTVSLRHFVRVSAKPRALRTIKVTCAGPLGHVAQRAFTS
jgi:hypothetical protein